MTTPEETVTGRTLAGPLPSSTAAATPHFGDRFTVTPDGGITGLICSGHHPHARDWEVGYHPSLDVLIEQAHAHNAAEHGGAP